MSKKLKGLKCPNCKKPVGLGRQMTEWDNYWGSEIDLDAVVSDDSPSATVDIRCDSCEESVALVFIEPAGMEEEMYDPILKEKIRIPRLRTN